VKGEFENKAALVTGGGSGIGAAICRRLGTDGAAVVVADLVMERAEDIAAEINAGGGRAWACQVDVASAKSVKMAVELVIKNFGALHLAVNNAGISGPLVPTAELDERDWQSVIDINLTGVFHGLKYEILAFLANNGGAIVNIASVFGSVGRASMPAYVAAKHGVVGLTKAAALDYAGRGIRVNAVAPGVIDTPLLRLHTDEIARDTLRELHPQGRFGQGNEVAELVVFLLSERASFINGSCHMIDGGLTAR
jgi:NAD(P)-dependent dehydrogenase (short-subunit alcohol dehydrogenase family)